MSKQEKMPYKKRNHKDYSLPFKLHVVDSIVQSTKAAAFAKFKRSILHYPALKNAKEKIKMIHAY